MEEWINVKNGVPENCNDCMVEFEDGTKGKAYYGGGGGTLWCQGLGMPVPGKVVSWMNTGNCDSIKHLNPEW